MAWTGLSPYKGLAPFEDSELDAAFFFGRDREQEIITANLTAARLTLLYGSSGVGKSSVLRAGVVRRLRALPGPLAVVVFDGWRDDPGAAPARSGRRRRPASSPAGLARGHARGGMRAPRRRALRDPRRRGGVLRLPRRRERAGHVRRRLSRCGHAARAARVLPAVAARGRARRARPVQGADPEPVRELAPPRAPRPARRARGDRRAARAVQPHDAGGPVGSSPSSSRPCSTRWRRGKVDLGRRRARRRRDGGGRRPGRDAVPLARHGAALAGRAGGGSRLLRAVDARGARRRRADRARPPRRRARRSCRPRARRPRPRCSTTSSRRPGTKIAHRCRTSPSTRASREGELEPVLADARVRAHPASGRRQRRLGALRDLPRRPRERRARVAERVRDEACARGASGRRRAGAHGGCSSS